MTPGTRIAAVALLVTVGVVKSTSVRAACNALPPGTDKSFRGTLGSVDRPFAAPGEFTGLSLTAQEGSCPPSGSPGFDPIPANNVVTIVFTPPAGGRNVVALAADCAALEPKRAECAASPSVNSAVCIQNAPGLVPDVTVTDAAHLRFRFPDTDLLVGAPNDDRTLTGPATIAVTRLDAPLPCGLASEPCAAQAGLVACVDGLFAEDGACGSTPDDLFPHFTALPVPNDFQSICCRVRNADDQCIDSGDPCTGTSFEVRFTVDSAGNVLMPMHWREVLGGGGVPKVRLLGGNLSVLASLGGGPLRISPAAFQSFSPEGNRMPPALLSTGASNLRGFSVFGSADAPDTVLRLTRHLTHQCAGGPADGLPCARPDDCPSGVCGPTVCFGGTNQGLLCTADRDCPAGECGPSYFDFRPFLEFGVGPIVVLRHLCLGGTDAGAFCLDDGECSSGICGGFTAKALQLVPLDSLALTQGRSAFVISEELEGQDLNGDGDAMDEVIVLADRGVLAGAIGSGGAIGRAVTRVSEPPFSVPGVAAENGVVAFLESEDHQGHLDANGDGDAFDAILRVYRVATAGVTEISAGSNIAVDAAPLIDHHSLVLSDGKLFFRTPEAAGAPQLTTRVAVGGDGSQLNGDSSAPSISADGRYVAFASRASNAVPGDTNGLSDVFIHDRVVGATELVTLATDGSQSNGSSFDPFMSADGRYLVFASDASNLTPGDTNGFIDVFLRDRVLDTTQRISVTDGGGDAHGTSRQPSISADGRFVAFVSDAPDLVVGGRAGVFNVFVYDRLQGTVAPASVAAAGELGDADSLDPSLSADGRFVVYFSRATNLGAGEINGNGDIFVRDRIIGLTERISVAFGNARANAASVAPAISPDGRFITFTSRASNLVPGDTNGTDDVFIHDRLIGRTERVSVATDGTEGNGQSFGESVSADGRFVAFASFASNLVPGDTNGQIDIFIHDRLTRATDLVTRGFGAVLGDGASFDPAISADARFVAFFSAADNLVSDDTNGSPDIFVRGIDVADASHDLDGDGLVDHTVLQVMDTVSGAFQPILTLGSADQVSVAAGRAAFIAPGLSSAEHTVHFWSGGSVQDLGLPASAVVLSDSLLAALVSESGVGADLNGDGDMKDEVVEFREIQSDESGHVTLGPWINVGKAGEDLRVAGDVVAFFMPEFAQGNSDLNGDGDTNDRVMQIFRPSGHTLINLGRSGVGEFVVGATGLVAFSTFEAEDGADLNGDGDTNDLVLEVYDVPNGQLVNSGQTVVPCRQEACDPLLPFRVLRDTVTFLTQQGTPGNEQLVLQTLNVRMAEAAPGAPLARTHIVNRRPLAAPLTTISTVSLGICSDTGRGCVSDAECPSGGCFVPPGGCIRDLGTACDPDLSGMCTAQAFCEPTGDTAGAGVCSQLAGSCESNQDCAPSEVCRDIGQRFERVASPLSNVGGAASVFISTGRCVEDLSTGCMTNADCYGGQFCAGGACHIEQGTCRTDADCPGGTHCDRNGLIVAAADDGDGDEIPDLFDNCPTVPNVLQDDSDLDGVGDACDVHNAPCEQAVTAASIACRLTQLAGVLATATAPAPLKDALSRPLGRARSAIAAAVGSAEVRTVRRTKPEMRTFLLRLQSPTARRWPDAATRAALLELAGPIYDDLKSLLASLVSSRP